MASAGAGKPAQDFVVLPPKQTTELDLVKSLGKYISQRYSSAARKDFDDALRDLQQQRLDVSQSMEYSEGVLSGMWRYHGQLAFVEQRFPISPQSLNVVFRWTSAFEPSVSHAGASINLERVSVLWNIAYLYSRAGAEADRSTSDGAKHACNLFQVGARRRHRMLGPRRSRMPPAAPGRERRHRPRPVSPPRRTQLAAGVLEHAKAASSGIPARLLAWDSSVDGLAAARAVMLAQAQSCYCACLRGQLSGPSQRPQGATPAHARPTASRPSSQTRRRPRTACRRRCWRGWPSPPTTSSRRRCLPWRCVPHPAL